MCVWSVVILSRSVDAFVVPSLRGGRRASPRRALAGPTAGGGADYDAVSKAASAARLLRRRSSVSTQLRKRMAWLGDAAAVLRHISAARCHGLLADVGRELRVGLAVDATTHSATEESDAATLGPRSSARSRRKSRTPLSSQRPRPAVTAWAVRACSRTPPPSLECRGREEAPLKELGSPMRWSSTTRTLA